MELNTLVELLFVVGIIVTTIVRVVPKLKANNIFLNHPSNRRSDSILMEPRFRFSPMLILWLAILVGIGGSAKIIYQFTIGANDIAILNCLNSMTNLFLFCIIAVLAVFINSLVNDAFDCSFQNFNYALRSWLTMVCLSPVFSAVIISVTSQQLIPTANIPVFCLAIAGLGGGFAAILLGILILVANYVSRSVWSLEERKEVVLLVSQATIAIIMLSLSIVIKFGFLWAAIWLPYAIVMAICVRYYKFDPVDESPTALDVTDIDA